MAISRVRGCLGHSNWERSDVAYNAQLVLTGILLKPEVVYRRKEQINNIARSPWDDIQHKQVPALSIRKTIHIPRRPRDSPLPRLQTGADREISLMDATLAGVLVQNPSSARYATCRRRLS